MSAFRIAAVSACLGALVPCAGAQQATTGSVFGTVHAQDGSAVAGVSVTVTGPAGSRTVQTDEAGAFSIRFLPPGTYVVETAMPGFATLRVPDVVVEAGARTRQPLALLPGRTEEVTLTASAPLVDPKKLELTTVFKTRQVIAGKPIGSDFTDAAAFAPGVVSGCGAGDGNWSIGGSSGFENSYIVDGINVTDSRYGGVGSFNNAGFGALGPGVTTDILEEVQVKTAAFDAEYGQALGGVITGVIKSGTNRFSGALRGSVSDSSAGRQVSLVTGATNIDWTASRDVTAAVTAGGPLVKDRLFAFGAFNPVRTTRQHTIERIENPVLDLDPGAAKTYPDQNPYPASLTGGREVDRTRNNYAAKLTWNAAANQRLELVAFGDPSSGVGRPGTRYGHLALWGRADTDGDGVADTDVVKHPASFDERGGWSDIDYGAQQFSLRYDGVFGGDWFLEGQASFRRNTFNETSTVDDYWYYDRRSITEWYFGGELPYGIRIDAGGAGNTGPSADTTWDLAFKASRILGDHDFKFGAEYFSLTYDWRVQYSGPEQDYPFPRADGTTFLMHGQSGAGVDIVGGIPGCAACVAATGAPQYRAGGIRLNPEQPPVTGREWSVFAQDTWSIGDHWVIKLGLRTTGQELQGSEDFTLAFARDAEHPGYFTDTPTLYSSSGYSFRTELSPRLGVSFDPAGDGRTKIYASAARYYERVPADLAIRLCSNRVTINQMRFSDPQLTTRAPGPINAAGMMPAYVMEGTRLPYVDEATLGWQQLLRPDLALEVRGIYREQGRVLEDLNLTSAESHLNFYYWIDSDGDEVPDDDATEVPYPGYVPRPFGPYGLGNPGRNTGEEFGQPKRVYEALEILLTKRLTHNWQLTANYRYSRLRGNYEGLFRNDRAQANPNITSLFDFPDTPLIDAQYESGILNTDRPHVLNLLGSYFFEAGLEVAGAFQWASGVPRTPLLAHPIYRAAGELPGTDPRYLTYDLGAGRWMLGAQGEAGQLLGEYDSAARGALGRTPDLLTLDLHVGWRLPLRDTALRLGLDAVNVFNRQPPESYYDALELYSCIGNPDYGAVVAYQLPRTYTLSLEWAW